MKKYNTPKDDIEQFINTFSKSKDSMGNIIGVEIWFDNLAHVVIPAKHIAYLQMDGITRNVEYCAAALNCLVVNNCFDSLELAISNKMANIEYTGFDAEEDMTVFNRIEAFNDIIGIAVITVDCARHAYMVKYNNSEICPYCGTLDNSNQTTKYDPESGSLIIQIKAKDSDMDESEPGECVYREQEETLDPEIPDNPEIPDIPDESIEPIKPIEPAEPEDFDDIDIDDSELDLDNVCKDKTEEDCDSCDFHEFCKGEPAPSISAEPDEPVTEDLCDGCKGCEHEDDCDFSCLDELELPISSDDQPSIDELLDLDEDEEDPSLEDPTTEDPILDDLFPDIPDIVDDISDPDEFSELFEPTSKCKVDNINFDKPVEIEISEDEFNGEGTDIYSALKTSIESIRILLNCISAKQLDTNITDTIGSMGKYLDKLVKALPNQASEPDEPEFD